MATSTIAWNLNPGDLIRRSEVHNRYGGSRQSGISPCAQSDNILLFTYTPTGGDGYIDEWAEDGTFHYSGEGRFGDQEFARGNKAVRDSVRNGKTLRLFDGSGVMVRYVGEFLLDEAAPYHLGRALDAVSISVREVIVFHLVRAERSGVVTTPNLAVGGTYRPVDESIMPAPANPSAPDADLMGRNLGVHRRLQNALAQAITAAGLIPLSPTPEDPDFDLAWRPTCDELVVCEVKSLTASNESRQLRMGLGQVLDYVDLASAREKNIRGVLWVERAPSHPRWVDLCRRADIQLAWPGQEHLVIA
jgi:hypothetical protein